MFSSGSGQGMFGLLLASHSVKKKKYIYIYIYTIYGNSLLSEAILACIKEPRSLQLDDNQAGT